MDDRFHVDAPSEGAEAASPLDDWLASPADAVDTAAPPPIEAPADPPPAGALSETAEASPLDDWLASPAETVDTTAPPPLEAPADTPAGALSEAAEASPLDDWLASPADAVDTAAQPLGAPADTLGGGAPSEATLLLDDWLASPANTVDTAAPPALENPAATTMPRDSVVATPPAVTSLLDELSAGPSFESAATVPVDVAASTAAMQRLVLFTVADSTYGVRETFVSEVTRVPKMTLVPHVPTWVRGVTNLRGDIVSVVDARVFLGLDATSAHTGRLLVVRLLSEELSLGLLVDRVDQIASVPFDAIRPPVSPLDGALAPFLAGVCHVGERFVTVIDLDRLLRSAEIRQFESRTEVELRA